MPKKEEEEEQKIPESWANGGNVAVQAAFGSSHTERQRSLQNRRENLHLVCTAVLGDLKPLHQELREEQAIQIYRNFITFLTKGSHFCGAFLSF